MHWRWSAALEAYINLPGNVWQKATEVDFPEKTGKGSPDHHEPTGGSKGPRVVVLYRGLYYPVI